MAENKAEVKMVENIASDQEETRDQIAEAIMQLQSIIRVLRFNMARLSTDRLVAVPDEPPGVAIMDMGNVLKMADAAAERLSDLTEDLFEALDQRN